ncbi:hypothetical protein HIM_03665 [Hirsutella minnesotensis 3608]|uniref:Uncharacterized protein n=1 Tax=Hirsutella minnesotensis 3608 TaxID=1043627 RepID=A0A0F7ZVK8_9HYPO|nr:hypothetical protein HIM_03665 [Hirsutella minnesotensis 3608]
MDKLPRLRRKPKPPAIETSVRRTTKEAPGCVERLSPASSDIATATSWSSPPQSQQRVHINHQRQPLKKSAFRSLNIRASAKRARATSPVEQTPCSPILTAVVNHGGAVQQEATRAGNLVQHVSQGHGPRREMPGFLTLSTQEMDRKYHEILWAERLRVAEAHRNQNVDDYKWGHYQQLDFQQRGTMDRYSNIRPWNYNRVRLRVPPDEFDYVNASAISLSSPTDATLPPLRYIAMQGPTAPSFDCVWRMVAEQMPSPAVIVQLTTMHENGFVKCHQYFPHCETDSTWTLNEDDVWGDGWSAQLTFVSVDETADGAIEIRKLLLDVEGENETRVVWHLLYRRWPDFGVPNLEDMGSFFELMQLSRRYSAPEGPRIVHCSAGVGRTGTFICLEHLMRELEMGAFDNCNSSIKTPDAVFSAVESLRQQRRGMVQGEVQYQFIYNVMRKLWREKYGVPDDETVAGEPAAKRLEVSDPFTDDATCAQGALGRASHVATAVEASS